MGKLKVTIRTTLQDLHEIHEVVDKVRGKWIEVDKQTLLNLLMDHSAMYSRLIDKGEQINEREKTTKRRKL